jgi:ATP-dependent Zn protease
LTIPPPGFSGAELANLVNEAAIFGVRAGRDILSAGDFAEATDRILLGRREETNALLPDEKRAVAVHESGHALVAALSKHGDPIAKVTILPAGASPLRKIRQRGSPRAWESRGTVASDDQDPRRPPLGG